MATEAAAIASKEYLDKSCAAMEAYDRELRGDMWWLASVTSECTAVLFYWYYPVLAGSEIIIFIEC